eukprot:CAMPEP_0204917354 /NCGR_PEP_ID=MMETSP1397-20131031/14933_1 /ASSEMBLY_ACC=CAM_ASM_000891 /TAXON_ID=49980 /ORGANISM="Climacostomum Climacostomum virens, Strain Stock W-24" /LENGTH=648 /DNA_ID=CAMNT_0052090151 /DNA_START=136 /DNA_END=2079 /DNA_ORIENTATION=+
MRYYYQIIGLASGETQPSLLLIFENKRYLFNVGDGIQRLSSEHKLKLSSKLSDIFITALTPDAVSGLPGLMLTMMQASQVRRTLHGPPGISAFIQSALTFMWNQHFDIVEYCSTDFEAQFYRLTSQHFFQDSNITVRAIPLGVKNYDLTALTKDVATFYDATPKVDEHNLDSAGKSGMCYIIEGPKLPGKFLPQKALELGIKKGPAFGKLTKGETVEVDGRIIRPEDCMEPSPPIAAFAVVHSTSPDLLNDLPYIPQYLSQTAQLLSIVHLSPASVLTQAAYQSFVAKNPPVQHLVLNEESSSKSLSDNYVQVTQGARVNLAKLHTISPGLFPIHLMPTVPNVSNLLDYGFSYQLPKYGLKFGLNPVPEIGFDETELLKATLLEPLAPIEPQYVDVQGLDYHDIIDCSQTGSNPYLLFLGTGSMKPEKYRNASGIWLGDWNGSVLLDCGESTYSQMLLHFGYEQIGRVLSDLSAILITHMHADHHIGLLKVLEERRKYIQTPVTVIAPSYMEYYLRTCSELFGNLQYDLVYCETEHFKIPGLTQCDAVLVDHCPGAYGFVLKHPSGWSLTYSGDTRPCEALVQAGLNSTVLIHEATLTDDLHDFAVEVKHCTISETQDVFQRMKAWRLIMTHFSQRYAETCEAEANGW